jgi:flagellar hook-basal body complex protein FliE
MNGVPRVGAGGELAMAPVESTAADAPSGLAPAVGPGAAEGAPDFAAILEAQVMDASRLQHLATAKSEALARGASDDLHGTMITVKEADISLKLVGSVRNRLLDAFHELWRINL